MAFNNTLTLGTSTFERLENGKFILSTSTADQPVLLLLTANVKPEGRSEYVVKSEEYRNSSVPGAADERLEVYTVIRGPIKVFSQTEMEAHLARVNTFLSSANLTKLLRGER